jgi:hypothetical protein
MGVNLTDFAPSRCPHGHYIGRKGRRLTSWTPCDCAGAMAGDQPRRGHVLVRCVACQDEGRETVYSDPQCARIPRPE